MTYGKLPVIIWPHLCTFVVLHSHNTVTFITDTSEVTSTQSLDTYQCSVQPVFIPNNFGTTCNLGQLVPPAFCGLKQADMIKQ